MAVKLIKEGKLVESKARTISFNIGEKSQMPDSFDEEVMDLCWNGVEIYPKHDDIPCPWDAVPYIKDGKFIVVGGLMAGGPESGSCRIEVPVNKVNKYFDIKVTCNEEDEEELKKILKSYNLI